MTIQQELSSWNPFQKSQHKVKSVPEVGSLAPSTPKIKLPSNDHQPTIILFMRHCGCPFAEKIFLRLRDAAEKSPDVHCIAVSHSDESATNKWLQDVGGKGKLEVIIDHERESFSEYGLGVSSFWAVLNPWSLSAAMTIGKREGYEIRPTESGSRWQTAGLFAADGSGRLTYSHRANTSDDLGDLDAALTSLESE